MNRKRFWAAAAIISVLILVGFIFSVPHTRDLQVKQAALPIPPVPVVTLHDTYKKGTHTITGTVSVPNACTPIKAQANPIGTASSTTSIQMVITYSADAGLCLQVQTPVHFETTVVAPSNIPITANVNGQVASTTRS